jgi:hypothetical protein
MTHPEDAENELASSNRFAGSRQMTEQPVGIKGAKDDDDDMNIEFEPNDIQVAQDFNKSLVADS